MQERVSPRLSRKGDAEGIRGTEELSTQLTSLGNRGEFRGFRELRGQAESGSNSRLRKPLEARKFVMHKGLTPSGGFSARFAPLVQPSWPWRPI